MRAGAGRAVVGVYAGVVVGYGPNHEPLIGAVEPLGWVGPEVLETAKELYRTRFHGVDDPSGRRRESA